MGSIQFWVQFHAYRLIYPNVKNMYLISSPRLIEKKTTPRDQPGKIKLSSSAIKENKDKSKSCNLA